MAPGAWADATRSADTASIRSRDPEFVTRMERRFFLAISLAILVLYFYQVYFLPPPAPAPAATATAPAPAAPGASAPAEPVESAPAPPPVDEPAPVTAAAAEQEIVVRTGRVEAVLTNRG